MKWKEKHLATKLNNVRIQFPKYKEDEWWTMTDIKKEVKRRAGRVINGSVAGRIAKKNNLVKQENGIKVYHKDLVNLCVDYIKQYYEGFDN